MTRTSSPIRPQPRVTALFGGSAVLFHRLIDTIRAEDFEIAYRSSNPWKFMGNGFTEYEMTEGNDLSWYVEAAEKAPGRSRTSASSWHWHSAS